MPAQLTANSSEKDTTAKRLRKISRSYKPTEEDTFLVSFPKCGSNLVKHLLLSAHNKGEIHPLASELMISCTLLEESNGNIAKSPSNSNLQLIKTHMPIDWVPFSERARYILLTRNPKDVAVSLWHHFLLENKKPSIDLSNFVEDFVKDEAHPYSKYFQTLMGMLKLADKPNCILLTYENLVQRTPEVVEKLTEFAKLDPLPEETLKKVASTASLDEYKKVRPLQPVALDLAEIGSWRKYLNKEASDKIDFKFRDIFRGTSAEEWWIQEMSWKGD